MRNWKVCDSGNNSITFTAQSKTQAVKQYKRMFPSGRITSVSDEGEAELHRTIKVGLTGIGSTGPTGFIPIAPIRSEPKQRPNDLCSCGSGKKAKRCCLLKSVSRRKR